MNNNLIKSIILCLSLLGFITGSSQVMQPVKWQFETEDLGNNEYNLIFRASIDDGWTVYSQYTGDDGPVPTSIEYETKDGVTLVGEGEESGHKKEGIDPFFEVNVIKYLSDEPFIISQKVKLQEETGKISGYLTFMTCDNNRCLPPTDVDFSFSLSSQEKTTGNNDRASAEKDKDSPTRDPGQKVDNSDSPTEIANVSSEEGGSINEDIGDVNIVLPEEESVLSDQLTDTENTEDTGILDPVKWTFSKNKISDNQFELQYEAQIEDGWTVYSQYTNDDGPIPTSINYESTEGIELIGNATEEGKKKEGYDKLFEVNVIKFLADKPYRISQKVQLVEDNARVNGYLTYMACDAERCLPPQDIDFTFSFGKSSQAVVAPEEILDSRLEGNVIDQRIPSIIETHKDPLSECQAGVSESSSWLWTFIFGFAGGLLALLTPCVFPMIPITVSFFTKDTKRSGWMNGLIYGLSIIFIYVLLGLLITIVLGPEALNRLSTNWIANTLFFLIFIAFAFSFFGFYEITLPSSWTTGSDRLADKGGLIGIFFMAFTLALVSFSCTGPIIGTAIVQAASQGEYVGPFLVMLGFSTALALPFGLFAAFPAWLNTLPKSGSWMNSVKVFLGFLELALAFKFLSVADMTNHWGFLRYELFMGLWILIFLGLAAYWFGFIKFPHDSPIKKLSFTRKLLGVATLALVFYLGTGFMVKEKTNSYNALPLLSGIAPPANYNYFLPPDEIDQSIKKDYPSYSKCANNIDCFKDYYDGLAYAKKVNKPALLDFTGYGCVNCRKTEEHIWVNEKIRKKLNDEVVLISLYVDDDQSLSEPLVSKSRKKKLRNIGNKWADFQIVNFSQNSQPLYIMITPDEKVINSPRPYQEGVDEYNAFLECGINSYRNLY